MNIALRVWRQRGPGDTGAFVRYELDDLRPDTTVLEALDHLNEMLVASGEPAIAFDSGLCSV